jgi:hypothetical protein
MKGAETQVLLQKEEEEKEITLTEKVVRYNGKEVMEDGC